MILAGNPKNIWTISSSCGGVSGQLEVKDSEGGKNHSAYHATKDADEALEVASADQFAFANRALSWTRLGFASNLTQLLAKISSETRPKQRAPKRLNATPKQPT